MAQKTKKKGYPSIRRRSENYGLVMTCGEYAETRDPAALKNLIDILFKTPESAAILQEKLATTIVVNMQGGLIDEVWKSNPLVDITDVVFTEDPKAMDKEDRVKVEFSPCDEAVYTHIVDVDTADPNYLAAVLAASVKRSGS